MADMDVDPPIADDTVPVPSSGGTGTAASAGAGVVTKKGKGALTAGDKKRFEVKKVR